MSRLQPTALSHPCLNPFSFLGLSSGEGRVVVESLSDCEVGFRDRRGGHTGWKSFAFDRVWGPHEVSFKWRKRM